MSEGGDRTRLTLAVMTGFSNVYEDERRARSYSRLQFPGTYYLAFRDLPALCERHVAGGRALDFGCGTGRSTRFLRALGYEVTGIDVSQAMLAQAREADPDGDYRLSGDGETAGLKDGTFDLVLSAFTFDNVPTLEAKHRALRSLGALLKPSGGMVSVVSSPDMYVNEWASFSTKDFPENVFARSGDVVHIVMLDIDDSRPVEDVVCSDEDYRTLFDRVGMTVLDVLAPLADGSEPIEWKRETEVAPWVVYVLAAPAREREAEEP